MRRPHLWLSWLCAGLWACSAVTDFDTGFLDVAPGDGDGDTDADSDGDSDADGDGDGDGDGDTDADGDGDGDGDADPSVTVDILMMVDDSNSMAEEQVNLTESFDDLLVALTEPPDVDGDGRMDYQFVTDLHLGVISSDMGADGLVLTSCEDPDGDAGALIHVAGPNTSQECARDYPTYLQYDIEQPDLSIDDDFSCIAALGTGGCGFEQPLDAVVAALGAQAEPGGPNDGFLRAEARLAIVLLTDEDDCSTDDGTLFDPSAEMQLGPMNLRCTSHPERLTEVDRLVAGILPVKADPSLLSVLAISGVPPDLVTLTPERLAAAEIQTEADFQAILADPRMDPEVDPNQEQVLLPSCQLEGTGNAFPPRRIVEAIRQLHGAGAHGLVQSICQDDYTRPMQALARLVGRP